MKPHKLIISGLQSFRDSQEIDFDKLADRGMFGIFGPTGSGKSTILDALTLALYGKVGRAKSGKQGIINEGETSASVSFTFSIGAGEARKTYRVDRKYRTKDHISVGSVLSRLVEDCPTGEMVLADQENAVTDKLAGILGITLEDFVRAVVLPQGKFADFLTLKGADRRRMLERLFSLERYGEKLAGRVKSRKEEATARQGALKGELQGIGDASAEALAKAKERWRSSQIEAEQMEFLLSNVKQIHADADQVVRLQQELMRKRRTLADHAEREDDVKRKEQRLATAQKALNVRPWLEKAEEARRNFDKAALDEKTAQNLHSEASAAVAIKKQEFDAAREVRLREEPNLLTRRGQLETALELEQGMAENEKRHAGAMLQLSESTLRLESVGIDLKQALEKTATLDQILIATRRKLEECQVSSELRNELSMAVALAYDWEMRRRRVNEAKAEYSRRQQEILSADAVLQGCVQAEQQAKVEVDRLERELTNRSDACPFDGIKLAEEAALLDRLTVLFRSMTQQQADVHETEKRLAKLRIQYSQASREANVCGDKAREAETKHGQAQQYFNEAILNDRRRIAAVLAEDLSDGQACPVCGSLDHPRPAQQKISAVDEGRMQGLKSEMAAKQAEWKQAETLASTAREKVSALAAHGVAEAANLKQRVAQLEAIQAEIAGEAGWMPEICDMTDADSCQALLAEKRTQNDNHRRELELRQENSGKLQKQIEMQRKQWSTLGAELAAAQVKKKSAAEELSKATADLHTTETQELDAAAKVNAAVQSIGASPGLSVLDQVAYIQKMGDRIKQSDMEKETLERNIAVLENDRQKNTEECALLQRSLQAAEVERAGQTTFLDHVSVTLQELKARWQSITGGEPASHLLGKISLTLDSMQLRENQSKEAWASADFNRQSADANLAVAISAMKQAQENRKLAEGQLLREIEKAGFDGETKINEALMPDDIAETETNDVRAYREKLVQLQVENKHVEKELAGRSMTEEAWVELQQRLAGSEANRNEKNRVAIEAEQTHRELVAKHERWSEIDTELSALQLHLDHLEKIFSLIRGNMLVEYLAQEQMNVVLHNASERLKQLTHNRYALEIDSEGSFIVRDDANGGSRRPAGSLSGGETFQTSLALALALSDQIQLRGKYPLEFFFLDEGFGSLDRNALEVAMATLERLRHDRLTIGIISHVEELQQRMPRRLVVTPPDLLGKGSRVKIEIQ